MWPRFANVAIGVWLTAAPALLGYGDPAATNDRILGPTAAAIALVAAFEATRPLRRLNFLIGAWLLVAPWLLGYGAAPLVNSLVSGLGMMVLASVRGKMDKRLGGGWAAVFGRAGH